MAKILITGGSGLIGTAISDLLIKKQQEPRWLSREAGQAGAIKKYKWDVARGYIDEAGFEGVEHIIHLAGAGIVDKRWTDAYKKEIIDSRVKSSDLLFRYLSRNAGAYGIKTLIGASAIGYYGARQSDQLFTEDDFPGTDFLAKSCSLWEKSYFPFPSLGLRTVVIRNGVVLSARGGAYPKMAGPFKLGLGAAVASGKQYFPWIHVNDTAALFVHALFNESVNGTYNGVASELVTNKQFSAQLAQSFHKPFFLPNVPALALKVAIGEGAMTLTEGLKISNQKIKNSGFRFEFETLQQALAALTKQR